MAKNSIRKQYARMSAKFRYDLQKLENRAGDVRSVRRYKGEFPSLTALGNMVTDQDLKQAMKQMKEIRASGQLSLRTKKRAPASMLDTLHREGYEYIDEGNIEDFYKFMEDARARGLGAIYGSDRIAQLIQRGMKKGLTRNQIIANMESWAENEPVNPRYSRKRGSSSQRF